MNRKNSIAKIALQSAALGLLGMSLLQCVQPAQLDSNSGNGGASGGQSGSTGRPTGTGGADFPDAASIILKLDVPPAIWGEQDAPQGPEVSLVPTVDSNCGILTVETTRPPVDVLLLLDRSASMNWSIKEDYCYCDRTLGTPCSADGGGCTDRWGAVIPAVSAALASDSTYVHWGLKFFSSSESDTNQCTVNPGAEVKIDEKSADDIRSAIANAKLSLSTPTAAGITAATAYLKTVTDDNEKVILLATDGEPNCGGTPPSIRNDDMTGSVAAATAANAAGFPVYVVGIGPNLSNLSQMAKAGGTKDYYPVSSTEELTKALEEISKLVGSCDYKSKTPPPDEKNVAVYVNKKRVAQNDSDGWKYGDTTSDIVLTGSYCDQLKSGDSASVQILFGCPGAPPFDDIIP